MKKSIIIFIALFCLLINLICGQTNLEVKKTIDSLYEIDQNVQLKFKEAIDNKLNFDSIQKLQAIEMQTFATHIPVIKDIYLKFGYPTIKMVGQSSSKYYFILIQHSDSDPKFQSYMLPTLKKLSKKGQISIKDYVYLYDRVQRNIGKQQLYGTQLSFDNNGNLFDSSNKIICPKDLADPANVDKRRKKVGLVPIEKYYEETLEMFGRPRRKNETLTQEFIKLETDKIFDKLVTVRRGFHQKPELAGKEKLTQETIKKYLLDLGLQVQTDIYGYGVLGILQGSKKGKKIAWRAEMDALPNEFPDNVDFKSTVKNVQHGCGHDIHMAITLGIAEVLAKNKKSLNGTVYFIFQPEEETFTGAKSMIDNGLLSKIKPEEIYGLHVTALPVGQIMVKPNEIFAYQKKIRIKLKNELFISEAKELTKKIYNFLSRSSNNSKPWELQNISDSKIGLMNPNTIFKDYLIMDENFNTYSENGELFLETYLYETNSYNLKKIIPKIKQIIETYGYKDKLLSISFIQENPTVVNDEKLTHIAIKTLENIYGKGLVISDYGQVPFFNDDFAYFQQKIPGVYFILGGSNIEKGIIAMNHSPNFKVDEECIRTGVKSFSSLLLERLKN